MEYSDKKIALDHAKSEATILDDLHPTEKVEAFRELGAWAYVRARAQDKINERHGIPERPGDLDEKVARSGL